MVLVIVVVVGLLALTAIPRQREGSRMVTCRSHLREIGVGLVLVDRTVGRLPTVPPLGPEDAPPMSGPLASMLRTLGLPGFVGLTDPDRPPADRPGAPAGPLRLRGLICPSDGAERPDAAAPVSYRATTGGSVDGRGGVFAPGRPPISLAEVEAADGLAYTAVFSERLLGSGVDASNPRNYAEVPGPVGPSGCPELPPGSWRGDAGSSWAVADWSSTLYTHALPPGGTPSCIANDRRTALMGASSGHVEGVNVLRGDLSVSTTTRRVDRKVWQALADLDASATSTPPDVDERVVLGTPWREDSPEAVGRQDR